MTRNSILASVFFVLFFVCVFYLSGCKADYPVYADSLDSKFADYSWATHNLSYTSGCHSGTSCISIVPSSYQAFYLFGAGAIIPSLYSAIQFWIFRPTISSTVLNFNLVTVSGTVATIFGPNNPVSHYCAGGNWTVNTWTLVTVSLSLFNQTCDGLWLQDLSGNINNAILVDDITLVSASSSSTSGSAVKSTTSTTGSAVKSTTSTTGTAVKSTTSTTVKMTVTSSSGSSSTTSKSTTTGTAVGTTGSGSTTGGAVYVSGDSAVLPYYSNTQTGTGTYYPLYTGDGACMLDPTPDIGLTGIFTTVAAFDFLGSKVCGMCINVTGTGSGSGLNPIKGPYTVYVNNQCPTCNAHSLDFALGLDGAWGISWIAVPCPTTEKIQYVFKTGSSVSWIAVQVRNSRYPAYTFSIYVNGNWQALPRQTYNYFVGSFSNLVFPIKVQLVSVTGQVITDTIQSLQPQSVIITGGVQFS